MASTLVMMCVVRILFLSDCCYLYCVGFCNVSGSNPSMVRLFLSFIKYVHGRQRDKASRRAETDKSVKDVSLWALSLAILSFQSYLFACHLYRHAWFNT